MKKILVINSISFYCKLNPNTGLRHRVKSYLIALWNFLSFAVSQFVTSQEPHLLFIIWHFSLFTEMMTEIQTSGVIINKIISLRKGSRIKTRCRTLKIQDDDLIYFKQLKLFSRQKFVISTFESQTQLIHALSVIISYLQRSNVLQRPTLVFLSQTRFPFILSGS